MDSADCGITRKPEIILSVPPPTKEDTQDGSISLEENSDAVITGRLVDPSLEFGLETSNHNENNNDNHGKRRSSVSGVILNLGHEIQRVPDLVVNEAKKVGKNMNTSHATDPFTIQSMVSCIFSMLLSITNYGTDILVAIQLYLDPENTEWWFTLTLIFVIVPLVIVNMFSIFWFHQDHLKFREHKKKKNKKGSHEVIEEKQSIVYDETEHPLGAIFKPLSHSFSNNERKIIIISHLLTLGPILRFVYILYCGLKERMLAKALTEDSQDGIKTVSDVYNRVQGPYCPKPDTHVATHHSSQDSNSKSKTAAYFYSLRKYYERDSAYLGLIEAFIQDGPQLILQLYILAIRDAEPHDVGLTGNKHQAVAFYQCASVLLSLVSLSWSIVSYQQANRWARPEKPQMSPIGCWFQFLWKFFMIASRVMIMSLFATVYKVELFIFIGLHWVLMTIWILLMDTNFCGSAEDQKRRPFSEVIYNIVMGLVFTFDIVNVKDGPTRYKLFVYYVLAMIENAALLALWYIESGGNNSDTDPNSHTDWTHDSLVRTILIALIPSCYVSGIACMLTYYRCFHPEGKMPDKSQVAKLL